MKAWDCPVCGTTRQDENAEVVKIAARSHLKSHSEEDLDRFMPKKNRKSGGTPSGKSSSGGFLDDLLDGIASIFD